MPVKKEEKALDSTAYTPVTFVAKYVSILFFVVLIVRKAEVVPFVQKMNVFVETVRGEIVNVFVPYSNPTLRHLKEAICEEEGSIPRKLPFPFFFFILFSFLFFYF
jgi:hypothetical protein